MANKPRKALDVILAIQHCRAAFDTLRVRAPNHLTEDFVNRNRREVNDALGLITAGLAKLQALVDRSVYVRSATRLKEPETSGTTTR